MLFCDRHASVTEELHNPQSPVASGNGRGLLNFITIMRPFSYITFEQAKSLAAEGRDESHVHADLFMLVMLQDNCKRAFGLPLYRGLCNGLHCKHQWIHKEGH